MIYLLLKNLSSADSQTRNNESTELLSVDSPLTSSVRFDINALTKNRQHSEMCELISRNIAFAEKQTKMRRI